MSLAGVVTPPDGAGLFPGRSSRKGGPPVQRIDDYGAGALLQLLTGASHVLEEDHGAARALLDRASALVQAQCDGQRNGGVAGTLGSALAPWQRRRVTAFVDDQLEWSMPLSRLAEVAGLSTSYFSRAFKNTFGQSPHSYILGRRIARAQYRMLADDEPLCQVALSCGFADQAHFSRVFRRLTRRSPNEWRRSHKAGPRCETGNAETNLA